MKPTLAVSLLVVAASLGAQPQNISVSGRVTSADGKPIAGANIFSREFGLSATTNAGGTYAFVVPLVGGRASGNVNVRAVGYVPQARLFRVHYEGNVAPPSRMDWVMQRDTNRLDNVTVPEYEPARVPFSVARVANQNPGGNVPGQADPFGRFLFPPELVMQYQGALDLQESQREALQNAIQEAQTQMLRLQWALAGEGEKLTKLLAAESVDEKEALAQVDRILMTEREIKRAQMTLMVRIRNTLTPEQRQRLRQVRGQQDDER